MSKENYQLVLDHKMPHGLVQTRDHYIVFTPGERNTEETTTTLPDGRRGGTDWFGCHWAEVDDGLMQGATLAPGETRLSDLADFAQCIPTEEQVRAYDWKGYAEKALAKYKPDKQILLVRSLEGFFERMHALVGFEDALCAFYEDPDAVHAYCKALLAYKKVVVDCVKEYFDPDILAFDDDYGTSRSTFFSPDMWVEFFLPYWKELVAYVHSKGMKMELHSCGYITPLVGYFVEAGMDILQPLQTNNDLQAIKDQWGDKIILRLAIFDKQMAALNQTEEEVRADIRRYYEILAPGGMFLPEIVPLKDRYYEIQAEVQAEFEKDFFGQ